MPICTTSSARTSSCGRFDAQAEPHYQRAHAGADGARPLAARPGAAPAVHAEEARPLRRRDAAGRGARCRTGDSPDFFFTLGDLLLDWAAHEPARGAELLPMIESSWLRALSIGERPELQDTVRGRGSFLAAHNLAVLYARLAATTRPSAGAHASGDARSQRLNGAGAAGAAGTPARRPASSARCHVLQPHYAAEPAELTPCRPLPCPSQPPVASWRHSRQRRAHSHFAGRPHARGARAVGSHARKAFEQAATCTRDPAYALAAAHALIKAGQAQHAVARLRGLRSEQPALALAYTLESHACSSSAGRERGRARAAGVAGTGPARPRSTTCRSPWRCSAATATRGDAGVPGGAGAEDRRRGRALPPGHVVQGTGHEGRGRRMRAHRAGAGPGQQRALGARPARLPGARGLPLGSRRGRTGAAARRRCSAAPQAQRSRPAPSRMRCWSTTRSSNSRWRATTRCTWPRARCAAAARAARARTTARLRVGYLSADFHQHATSQLMVQMLECHDRGASRSRCSRPAPTTAAPMRQRMRAAAEHFEDLHGQGFPQMAAAHPRARHRHPGRPQGRDLRHAAAGAGAAAGAAAGDLAGLSRHHRRALHRLPDRRPAWSRRSRTPRTSARRSPSCRMCYQPNDAGARCRSRQPRRLGRARGRAAAVRLPPVVQDLGRGVRQLVPLLQALPDAVLWLLQLEHQRAGRAHARRGARAASTPSGWCSRRCCRSTSI